MASLLLKSMSNISRCAVFIPKSDSLVNLSSKKTLCAAINNLFVKKISTETTSSTPTSAASPTSSSTANLDQKSSSENFSSSYDDESEEIVGEEEQVKQERMRLKMSKKKQELEALKNHPFSIAKATKIAKSQDWQPTLETHSSLLIDGVPYNKTHIISIKASANNTILTLSDANGFVLYNTSGGSCGFKNSKKSTAVAGQAAGLAMSDASIKALQMGKLNIISITDRTPIPLPFARPPRPPTKRRL